MHNHSLEQSMVHPKMPLDSKFGSLTYLYVPENIWWYFAAKTQSHKPRGACILGSKGISWKKIKCIYT